jgi:two-component system chemotaxis sensor kinase CheA
VRVDFAKLDHLLNLVGELIVQRTKLQDAGREASARLGDDRLVRELNDAVHQLAGVSTQLQETIMDIRMLPIRNVFERLVRDLARAGREASSSSRRGPGWTRPSSTRSASRSYT